MARQNYGKVGGKRTGGAAWQWSLIGLTVGLGCSVVSVLGLLTLGILNLDISPTEVAVQNTSIPLPTPNIQQTVEIIVQATIASIPETAQQQVVEPTTTEEEQPQVTPPTQSAGVLVAPSATPPITSTPELVSPTATVQPLINTTGNAQNSNGGLEQPLNTSGVSDSGVPLELLDVISQTTRVDGGSFAMGTNGGEIAEAVRQCVERDGASCVAADGEDSTPIHEVTLNQFEIEITEVTTEQYVRFLNSSLMGPGSHANGCSGQKCIDIVLTNENSLIVFDSQNYDFNPIFADMPAVGVTWFGAQTYCESIGRRLPTEAEWELAARGFDGRIYPWGNDWDVSYARTNRPDPLNVGVVDVRSYPSTTVSPFGAYDMAGNAAEWVADWYSENFYSQPASGGLNPQGPPSGTTRSIRGGSWDTPPFFARSVHRQSKRPTETFLWLGFRCAQDFDPNAGVQTVPQPGALGNTSLGSDPEVEVTEEPINAAPTLPALQLPATATTPADATEVSIVPPGG